MPDPTPLPCGCRVEQLYRPTRHVIVYCSIHAAAFENADEIRFATKVLDTLGVPTTIQGPGGEHTFNLAGRIDSLGRDRTALLAALKDADQLLAGMWSYSDESRVALAHTWYVKASDVIRAALAKAKPSEEDDLLPKGSVRSWGDRRAQAKEDAE